MGPLGHRWRNDFQRGGGWEDALGATALWSKIMGALGEKVIFGLSVRGVSVP